MNLARLKAKNQVTLPSEVVKKLSLKPQELFKVDIQKNNIVLIPVEVQPKYSQKELRAAAKIVRKNKGAAKTLKPGREFKDYIDGLK